MTLYGDKLFKREGFPTPESIPTELACRTFRIPASSAWLGVFMGALELLTHEENWQQFEGGITREEAAAVAQEIIDQAYAFAETGQCDSDVPTPYWDDSTDLDDQQPVETQEWYGRVEGGTFIEDMADWVIAGFIAAATTVDAAIAYRTVVPRARIAFRRGDVGEVIRVLADGVQVLELDTSSAAAGEIVETTYALADTDEPLTTPVTLTIVKVS